MGLGGIYLFTDEFMSYHADAIETGWGGLESNYQGLFLGLQRGLGAGAFTSGVALVALSVMAFLKGIHHYRCALALVALVYSCLLTYAMYTVYSLTPAVPPLTGGAFWIALSLIAMVCAFLADRGPGAA